MAIGCARMLGYRFNRNFDHPYISLSITEFWRRWHISLSGWLRDYLYISLGGNRKGQFWTYVNLIVTMLLGGLWHGASWNFIFWGGWHGSALAVHKIYMRFRRLPENRIGQALYHFLAWGLTMMTVLLGWVFFRNIHFRDSLNFLAGMFGFRGDGIVWHEPFVIAILATALLFQGIVYLGWLKRLREPVTGSVWYWWMLTTAGLVTILFKPVDFQPFIYFQF